MTADAAPGPAATSQKVSRAGAKRKIGSCLKSMGLRHDNLLQAGPSLCRGSGYLPRLPGSMWAYSYCWDLL